MPEQQIKNTPCANVQVWIVEKDGLHVLLVKLPVDLRSWSLWFTNEYFKRT